jgi:general secretion pathway protein A
MAVIAVALGAGLVLLAPGEVVRDEPGHGAAIGVAPSDPTLAGVSVSTAGIAGGALEHSAAPSLAELLRDPSLPATKGDALTVLLDLWGVRASGVQPDCERPPPGSLECLTTTGTWQKLRRLDLPAALELSGPEGERLYAVLTGLTPSEATLRFGDRVVTALLAEIEPFWDGAFVMFWRPPPGAFPIQRGARGPATDWLRERMARSEGAVPALERGQPYDEGLQRQVVAFQHARSLEPDGVVGRETAILLRRAEWDTRVPRLSGGDR